MILEWMIVDCEDCPLHFMAPSFLHSHCVARFFVERGGLVHDLRLIDFLGPVPRADFFHRDRDGFFAVVKDIQRVEPSAVQIFQAIVLR